MLDTTYLDTLLMMGYAVELINDEGIILYSSNFINKEKGVNPTLTGKRLADVYNFGEGNQSCLLRTLKTAKEHKNILTHNKSETGRDHFWITDAAPVYQAGKRVGALGISKPYHVIKETIYRIGKPSKDATPYFQSNSSRQYKTIFVFEDIVHQCSKMQEAINDAKSIANSLSSVLLVGETGTGKELFAQSIHNSSPRSSGPFVAINCSAIPETLLESTLFGTSKGAYTGAVEKKGLFEEAVDGSLFLDEINSMNLELQGKILRFLETKTFRKVGSNYEIMSNARIISATNEHPLECIQANIMRPDLFFRLAVTSVSIPPLRNRTEDISLLAGILLTRSTTLLSKGINKIAPNVMELFRVYQWPGNVRELQHIIEHATNIAPAEETTLQKYHLPYYFIDQFSEMHVEGSQSYEIGDYKTARAKVLDKAEKEFAHAFITAALNQFHGNITKTAQALRITRQHLHRLINEYSISVTTE